MSQKYVDLLDARRTIPSDHHHNRLRREVRKKLKLSLWDDEEAWLTEQAKKIEIVNVSGNFERLFQLIWATGGERVSVIESISEEDGSVFRNKARRLNRWAKYFENKLSWLPETCSGPLDMSEVKTWEIRVDPPNIEEVKECLDTLRRRNTAGPDTLSLALFKEGDGPL